MPYSATMTVNCIMKRFFLLVCCFVFALQVGAQGLKLSSEAEVHLLTSDPGVELYTAFGHSSFRITDPPRRFDRIYNYGTFSFNTPGFYKKFIRGQLPYYLAAESVKGFVRVYGGEGRHVRAQVLNLDSNQVQEVYDYLENNLRPENREYQYDFFFDNCATRERDVMQSVFGKNLDWQPWADDSLGSVRDLIDIYLADRSWADFGIDIILGLPTDVKADMQVSMFLPDYLHDGFARARILNGASSKPLVDREYLLVKPEDPFKTVDTWLTPLVAMWGLFLVILIFTVLVKAKSTPSRIFDFLLYLIVGLAGALILFMWLATDHDATQTNLNIFWIHPLYLGYGFVRLFAKGNTQYAWARWNLFALGLYGLAVAFLPQGFHPAFFPMILTLALRSLHVISAYRNE